MRQNTQRMGDKYKLNTYTLINETDFDFSKLSLGLSTTDDKDLSNVKNIKHTDYFTQWQGLVIDNEISLGARVIDHDKFSSHTTYNLNWAKDLSANTRVNASYGSATNLPSHFQEKKNLEHGQTSLKPERSKSIELGLKNDLDLVDIEFKVYKSKVVDSFDYHYLNFVDYDGYYFNNKTVDITGAELSIKTELLGWDLNTNLDFNRSIDRDTKKQRGRRPNRSISLNLLKSSGKWKRNINWSAKSSAWDGQSETTKLGGYGLLNLSTSYNFTEDLSVYLNRNNALDKNYEMAKGYNTLGKTTTIGLTYNF